MLARLRTIQTPSCTAVLLVLAYVSLSRLPGGTSTDRSTIGTMTKPATPIAVRGSSQSWYLQSLGSQWSLIAGPDDSADTLSKAVAAAPASVVDLRRYRSSIARGFYDPTTRTRRLVIDAEFTNGSRLTPDELRSLLAFLNSTPGWETVPTDTLTFKPGSATRTVTTIEWHAVAHNILAAMIWLALPISLGWVPRMICERRADRRQRAGLCPACAYDRRATPVEAPCPECGQAQSAATTST